MRRMILAGTGLLLAFLVSATVLLTGLLLETLSAAPEAQLNLLRVLALIFAAVQDGAASGLAQATASMAWRSLVTACFIPVALVAAIAEVVDRRSLPWLAGGTGLLTAALPTLLEAARRGAAEPGSAPLGHWTALLFLTGAAGGAAYWVVAGVRRPESQ